MAQRRTSKPILVECAWEACNQVGGIYTVLRSKAPTMVDRYGDNYCLLGPYFSNTEFEPAEEPNDPFYKAVKRLREMGFDAHYGYWLVTGRPKVVLLNPFSAYHKLGEIKYLLWEHHDIAAGNKDDLLNQVIAFGHMAKLFLSELARARNSGQKRVLAHFHEWMAGTAIPSLRREQVPVTTVFTTHATLLGRYLAQHDPLFYSRLPEVDWLQEAIHFNHEAQVRIERAAAHGAHIFSTVSEVTAQECIYLLGRNPEVILPNGLNIQRFTALHEFQNLHLKYKEAIHEFIMGHFFKNYHFDLDKTLYFFTSGRYEYKNKGYDLTLEALARLNHLLHQEKIDITIVMFFVTKRPFSSINPDVLQSRAVMEELQETCRAIERQVGERLYYAATAAESDKLPQLNDFIDEYWRFRYRRTLHSWKQPHGLPPVVTHNLIDDDKDEVLDFLRVSGMVNKKEDKVKIVYHPDFINSTNPLFHLDYGQFVRGCHLGIFPSYYEPWGYTPLECIARGVPTVTSDLAGFGNFLVRAVPKHEEKGIYLIERRYRSFDEAADQLARVMLRFIKQNRRERIKQRNNVEGTSETFDWKKLTRYYEKAYKMALEAIA